ncbi:hypothetical protein BZG02_08435 [Labilibaculum filiforme]|uniref:DUF302 domain-containing protein n=1 Tax=Labilibaculum filiforme TaxID=1940526 RepID=A0A2N3HZD1_9BACT|nr:DUF302 domain-containing protein [Labilibaculum filiforme]PKQ63404.1 hypothetical protein BZG02_08435 [Labilibaculum filiforme]
MKNITIIVSILLGFTLGILFTGIALSVSSGEMMIKEFKSPYDFEKSVEVIKTRINAKEGWHVTTIIDQNQEIIDNGGKGIGKYHIIKYCHAGFSERMLNDDRRKKIGNMMPKSFAVYEKADGQVFISTMNGAIMGKIFGGEIENIIEEVSLDVEDMMRFIHLKYSLF